MNTLKIQNRNLDLKTKVLLQNGEIPGVLYGRDIQSTPVKCDLNDIYKAVHRDGQIYQVTNNQKKIFVRIDQIQKDPVNGHFKHFSLVQLPKNEKNKVDVPIEMQGNAPGVKEGGTLVMMKNEVELHGLIKNLPDKLIANIDQVKIGDHLSIKDLNIPKGVTTEDDLDTVVIVCNSPAIDTTTDKESEPTTDDLEQVTSMKA